MIRAVFTALTVCAFAVVPALADTSVKVSRDMSVAQVAAEIAYAARDMCVEAQAAGEVDDVPACVVAVVAAVAAETGNEELIAYVAGNQPEVRRAAFTN